MMFSTPLTNAHPSTLQSQRYDFWKRERAERPPNFFGSQRLGSATMSDLSYAIKMSLISFFGSFIYVLFVVCHNTFRDSLAHCINLAGETSTPDTDANVDFGPPVFLPIFQRILDILQATFAVRQKTTGAYPGLRTPGCSWTATTAVNDLMGLSSPSFWT